MYVMEKGNLGSGFVELCLMLMLFSLFLLFRAGWLILRVFITYPKNKHLWFALAGCVGCLLVSAALALPLHELAFIPAGIGVAWLLIACKAVEVRNSDRLMRQPGNIVNDVLHTPWWADENTHVAA